jgi:hypothetical protein
MTNYKNLLLALGITISGSQLVDARENSLLEDVEEASSIVKKSPFPVFLEIDVAKDMAQDDFNVGCSVTNSGC